MQNKILKNLLFTIVVPGTVAVYAPWTILNLAGHTTVAPGVPRIAAGAVVTASGVSIYIWCVWNFAKSLGTLLPIDPPKKLVAHGLYRFSRNPMYIGVLSAIAGQAIIMRSALLAIYCTCVFIGFHCFTVFYEEPTLRRQFGAPYEEYLASTSRWLNLGWRGKAPRE